MHRRWLICEGVVPARQTPLLERRSACMKEESLLTSRCSRFVLMPKPHQRQSLVSVPITHNLFFTTHQLSDKTQNTDPYFPQLNAAFPPPLIFSHGGHIRRRAASRRFSMDCLT